ncbi:MAG: hypothetical protein NTV51_12620, partial [Verrucomicrobia bacterium]|nr:hypothetical protein [Verrucomicrobiota bacterium]
MIPSRLKRTVSVPALLRLGFAVLFCALTGLARAQFTYAEDFKNSTAPGWVLNHAGNSTPGAVLTSGT